MAKPVKNQKKGKKVGKKKGTRRPRAAPPAYPPAMRMSVSNRMSGTKSKGHKQDTCSVLDPFCPHARNAHYPDGQGNGTLTMPIKFHQTVGTLGNGGTVLYVSANLPYSIIGAASYATGNYTLGTAYVDATAGSLFGSWAQEYRIVSWGLIIRSTYPAASTQGYVIVTKLNKMPAVSASTAAGSVYGIDSQSMALYAGQEIHVVGKPTSIEARNFVGLNSSTTQLNLNWDVVRIEVVGAALSALNVADVEIVYNLEVTDRKSVV